MQDFIRMLLFILPVHCPHFADHFVGWLVVFYVPSTARSFRRNDHFVPLSQAQVTAFYFADGAIYSCYLSMSRATFLNPFVSSVCASCYSDWSVFLTCLSDRLHLLI